MAKTILDFQAWPEIEARLRLMSYDPGPAVKGQSVHNPQIEGRHKDWNKDVWAGKCDHVRR